MVMMTWLADVLRTGGVKVEETDGWKTRGLGEMGQVRGVLAHHTAGPLKGDRPSMALVLTGRPDLRGPLSQLFLTRAGVWVVLAAGRCNHAGVGAWHGVVTGNSSFIGVEAENAGTGADPWPDVQMQAYIHGVAAILKHLGEDAVMAAGHKEYATPKGRKIDPSFDMVQFRGEVEAAMEGVDTMPRTVVPTNPTRAMLRKGDQGADVYLLQVHLGLDPDSAFGPKTEDAVKAFQAKHDLKPDGFVGPATWKALGVS